MDDMKFEVGGDGRCEIWSWGRWNFTAYNEKFQQLPLKFIVLISNFISPTWNFILHLLQKIYHLILSEDSLYTATHSYKKLGHQVCIVRRAK